jgi:hypothetical protein|tara:strand:- start:147 stop:521 length:375 start_codon:yes stop_codon:yes gene_type:complete
MELDKSKIKALFMEGLSCRTSEDDVNSLDVGFMSVQEYLKSCIPAKESVIIYDILFELNSYISDIGLQKALNDYLYSGERRVVGESTITHINNLIKVCEYKFYYEGGQALEEYFEDAWRFYYGK